MSEIFESVKPKCGEVWMCNLGKAGSSVQYGTRPVYILSNNINNLHSPTLNVIPITSKMNKRHLPVHVELWNYMEYGLHMPSTMLIEQIMTISAETLDRKIGEIADSNTVTSIRKAMSIQFPILQ